MLDIFKLKDHILEFENRCRSKVEENVLKTRERHGLERAKLEENIIKPICNCIAPFFGICKNIETINRNKCKTFIDVLMFNIPIQAI